MGRVRVVQNDGHGVRHRHLKPPRDGRGIGDRLRGRLEREIGEKRRADRRERVLHIEATEEGKGDRRLFTAPPHPEAAPFPRQHDIPSYEVRECTGPPRRTPSHSPALDTGHDEPGVNRRKMRPGGILSIHHHPTTPPHQEEDPRLGLSVALHASVIVEMIARQIRQHSHIDAHSVEPMLVEGVRRCLDRHCSHAPQ